MQSNPQFMIEYKAPWRRTLRGRTFEVLERSHVSDSLGRFVDIALVVLILFNILSVMMETVESVYSQYKLFFDYTEYISVAIFTVEYLARLWACVDAHPPEERGTDLKERLNWILSPAAIIDFVAIAPFFLSIFFFVDLRFLRVLRLLRILKLTRYSAALTMLLDVFRERANAFYAGFFILLVLLVIASSGAYLVEHKAQPQAFGSIPHAMWWAVSTLTTVGYGDVTPITPLGQIFGAFVTIIGIGMAALPAGILASGLADHLNQMRQAFRKDYMEALEDGIIDADETAALEIRRKELGLSVKEASEIEELVREHKRQEKCVTHCPHCGKPVTIDE